MLSRIFYLLKVFFFKYNFISSSLYCWHILKEISENPSVINEIKYKIKAALY